MTPSATFNSAHIKHIALVTMLIDHIGVVLLPDVPLLRLIGRLSFILFVFLLAEGALHTRSRLKYGLRLFALALISQVPYSMAKYGETLVFDDLNVFFLLASSVVMIGVIDLVKGVRFEYLYKVLIVAAFSIAGYNLNIEYDFYGYALVACFYQWHSQKGDILVAVTAVTIALLPLFRIFVDGWEPARAVFYSLFESIGLISLVFILNYNGEKGRQIHKFFYYFFYPVHLYILVLIKML